MPKVHLICRNSLAAGQRHGMKIVPTLLLGIPLDFASVTSDTLPPPGSR